MHTHTLFCYCLLIMAKYVDLLTMTKYLDFLTMAKYIDCPEQSNNLILLTDYFNYFIDSSTFMPSHQIGRNEVYVFKPNR